MGTAYIAAVERITGRSQPKTEAIRDLCPKHVVSLHLQGTLLSQSRTKLRFSSEINKKV